MTDESAPLHQVLNELVHKLAQINEKSHQQLAGQFAQMEKSFKLIHDGIKDQTSTLGELQIIARIAEMQALVGLLEEEERLLAQETTRDKEGTSDLERLFAQSRGEIEGLRNQRVRELLAPVFRLLEEDLEAHIEARLPKLPEILEDCIAVTREAIDRRDAATRATAARSASTVERFVAQRRAVSQAVKDLQVPPSELPAPAGGVVYGVPVYVAEIREAGGTTSFTVVTPCRVENSPEHPLGLELRQGKDPAALAAALEAHPDLLLQAAARCTSREVVRASELPGATDDGSGGWARRSMLRHLEDRSVALGSGGSSVTSLSTLFEHHAGRRSRDTAAPTTPSELRRTPSPPATAAASPLDEDF
jgi:hypothetical protein